MRILITLFAGSNQNREKYTHPERQIGSSPMRIFIIIAAFTLAFVMAGYLLLRTETTADAPPSGPAVLEEPIQAPVDDVTPWVRNTYRITPLAEYDIRARVLSIQYYTYGREANLSPVDFALGWGPMSDPAVTKHFTVSQKDRWSSWRSKGSPITMQDLLLHSANVHLIPPNEATAAKIGEVKIGDVIRIRGKLIEAQGSDGWTWTSSLVRNDQGERSCEIIWVEHLEIVTTAGP